jgi:hypothetical protein
MIQCKICSEPFSNDKSFHAHLKKHNLYQAEYYCTHYPRSSLYYRQQIPFKNKKQYFEMEFLDYTEFLKWENSSNPENVKTKCIEMLKKRIDEKQYHFAPFHNELITIDLPSLNIYKKHFGSYTNACKILNIEPLYNKNLPEAFNKTDVSHLPILIDTREQDALEFSKSKIEKIFVGDYLIADKKYFTNTFVDRKSESDFLGTMASGIERFEKEVVKAVELNCYLFVVIESSINSILINQRKYNRKTNLEYVFHNMRSLCHKYPRHIQFVFTGSRNKSLDIIPKLLYHGKSVWQVDIQYFLDNELGNRQPSAKEIAFNFQ